MDNENVVHSAPEKQKMLPIVRYAIMAVIGIVALAVVINIIVALIPDKFKLSDANAVVWEENDDDQMVFLFNGKNLVEVDDDITKEMVVDSIKTDYNNEYAVFLTEGEAKDGEADNEGDGEETETEYVAGDLYVVNKKKVVKAADEVDEFLLSPFGSTYLYITDGDLYYGQLKNAGKATKIDTDVDYISAVSPDGKAFAYAKVEEADKEDEEDKTDLYVCTNGKKGEKFGKKDSEIVAIGNGAKYVYYVKDKKFYVNDSKLADMDDLTGYVMLFNRDGSQLIYNAKNDDDETKAYISAKAKDKNSFGTGYVGGLISPEGSVAASSDDGGFFLYYNTSSFAKTAVALYQAEEDGVETSYYYLKNVTGDSEKISSLKNADSIYMLEDAKTVLYIKTGHFYSINVTKPSSEPAEYIGSEDDIVDFDCTVDGEDIYTRDVDGTLYYVKSQTKMKKIKYDVVGYSTTADGKVYFVNDDGDLFYANKAPTDKKVASDVDPDALHYDIRSDVAIVEVDGEFGVISGQKFKKLFVLD